MLQKARKNHGGAIGQANKTQKAMKIHGGAIGKTNKISKSNQNVQWGHNSQAMEIQKSSVKSMGRPQEKLRKSQTSINGDTKASNFNEKSEKNN